AKMVKSLGDYNWSSYSEYTKENSIIKREQKEFVLGYFSNSLEQFAEFHKQEDSLEYLEIKEDIVKERIDQAQEMISAYCSKKGIIEAKQVIRNPVYLEEIIQNLLKGSKLSHRQIANLLVVSNNIVHNVSLYKD
ncbi:MAG TPA: hypothetical protein VEF53_07835, partial [Patescibacteria group bacterium]|nr:hypothetical protein [Patescibacteria group bacterium]